MASDDTEPSISEQLLASEACKRLAADPFLQQLLDALTADATAQAVFNVEPAEREAQRQLVLAIARLRGALNVGATFREQQQQAEHLAKSFE